MATTKLKFKPGIISDITSESNEGGYVDGDKVRFRFGFPEKMGGWSKYTDNTFQGSARRLHNWVALDGSDYMGIGTHLKYYIEEGEIFYDVTPIRTTTGAGDVTFSATDGSTIITVTDSAHGANENDFVTFSGAGSLGGVITADVLNQEYKITSIISSNSYTITSSVTANSSDTGNGSFTDSTVDITSGDATATMDSTSSLIVGATISGTGIPSGTTISEITNATTFEMSANATATSTNITATINITSGEYQINTGLDVTVGGTGWGAGQWSGTTSGALATTIDEGAEFSDSDTTLTVADASGIVATDLILIDDELLTVTNVSSNDLTVTRASSGTEATAHADGSLVRLAVGNADSDNDFVGWGNAASVTTPGAQIRLWSHDNFGEDLIINPRDGALYYWDKSASGGLSTRAVELSTLTGTKTSIPTKAKQILVSDQDRHVIAFGCDALNTSDPSSSTGDGVQDPLLVRFSSQENPLEWFPTATNTAGDLRLGGGSTFVQAVEAKQQILVFTDKTLHAMKFIGPPFTFGLQELSKNITIMSPYSAIAVEDVVFWMGVDTFYGYLGGQTVQLPCTVKDKVFLDFNFEERNKVHVGVNSEFSELIWFYPSANSTEIDKYVTYNYSEKIWYYGTMARQAWIDRGIRTLPIATGGQYLYNHEVGYDDDGSAMTSFIESAPIDIGEGDKFVFLNQIIPDITFTGSTSASPDVDFTVKAKNESGGAFLQTQTGNTQRTATSPVERYTEKLNYRLRGRSFALRIDSTSLGTKYKLGMPRASIREDGRR
tara:strand:- start:346 stop:2688 length:2343 start_codon:yes stop_codon:yes gene_type:complete